MRWGRRLLGCWRPPDLGVSAAPAKACMEGEVVGASPGEGAQGPRGQGPGSHPPPAAPHAAESRRAGAAAGGIQDGGLRRPPRVCPAPAAAAARPNLRYTCELASCPGPPLPEQTGEARRCIPNVALEPRGRKAERGRAAVTALLRPNPPPAPPAGCGPLIRAGAAGSARLRLREGRPQPRRGPGRQAGPSPTPISLGPSPSGCQNFPRHTPGCGTWDPRPPCPLCDEGGGAERAQGPGGARHPKTHHEAAVWEVPVCPRPASGPQCSAGARPTLTLGGLP